MGNLTVAELKRHIHHALHGEPDGLSVVDIVNAAGEWWITAHPWEYLSSRVALLDLSDRGRIELPPDFMEVQSIALTDTLIGAEMRSTIEEINKLRENAIDVTGWNLLKWTITYDMRGPEDENGPTTYSVPWIEYWPAPPLGDATGITLYYRAGWTQVVEDNVPQWARQLFIDVCRATALGLEEDEIADRDERLGRIMSMPAWDAACRADGRTAGTLGPTIRGVMSNRSGTVPWETVYPESGGGLGH